MALLEPNATYKMNGVTVNEKIIPDGTVWKDANKAKKAGFKAGELYKSQHKLCGTGKAKFVTIHNTDDLDGVHDDAEQYTRATYNENMGSARVHFFVDDVGAWQNLKAGTGLCKADPNGSAEISWHAGDGTAADGGNSTSISMEIIMNDNADHDAKAYDNGARMAAWLLKKHGLGIDKLVTHTYWVTHAFKQTFKDVDKQCTKLIYGQKWCPAYIFKSTNEDTALKNWKAFKALVKKYLDQLNGSATATPAKPAAPSVIYRVQTGAFTQKANADAQLKKVKAAGFDTYMVKVGNLYKIQVGAFSVKENANAMLAKVQKAGFSAFVTTQAGQAVASDDKTIKEGSTVKVKKGAKAYTGETLASYVYTRKHKVDQINGDRAVISYDGVIVAAVKVSDLVLA